MTRFRDGPAGIVLAAGERQRQRLPAVNVRAPADASQARRQRSGARVRITAFYTVFWVEGDDQTEASPTTCVRFSTDTVPPLEVDGPRATSIRPSTFLQSVSRTMPEVTNVEHRRKAGQVAGNGLAGDRAPRIC